MEVEFETPAGRQYRLEVGFFDTVLEMKQKLQKHHHIPVSKQTLFFNGTLMEDHKCADEYQLIHGSRINLFIACDPADHHYPPATASNVTLLISNPSSKRAFTLVANASSTVGHLKDPIRQADRTLGAVPFQLWDRAVELEDHRKISDYHFTGQAELRVVVPLPRLHMVSPPEQTLFDTLFHPRLLSNGDLGLTPLNTPPPSSTPSELEALVPTFDPTRLTYEAPPSFFAPPVNIGTAAPATTAPSAPTTVSAPSSVPSPAASCLLDPPPPAQVGTEPQKKEKKRRRRTLTMHVTVFEKEGKIKMEVHPGTKVAELRKWLERYGATKGLELPEGGYFFIHRQTVMEEECSFGWHEFQDEDAVEVFPGTVSKPD